MKYFVVAGLVENVIRLMEPIVIINKLDMTKKKKTYSMELNCTQCLKYDLIQVPFGMLVTEFCEKTTCPNCECGPFLEQYQELDPLL